MVVLNDKTRTELQAGINKLGLAGARKKLEEGGLLTTLQEQAKEQAKVGGTTGIQQVQPISSPVAKTGPTGTDLSGLEGARGYKADQVGIEGINLLKKPPVIGGAPEVPEAGGVPSPEDTTLPDTTGKGVTGIEGAPGVDNVDLNKDGVINENELTGDYKKFYDTLSETEKKLFIATGENAMKKNLDIAEVYANYMRDYNTLKGRKEEDEAYRLKQQAITGEMADIQESATLRRAIDGVKKLRQSVAYLGDMGMPGKSAQRMVSIDNQLTEAGKSLSELQKLQSLAKSFRAQGEIKKAREYEQQMEDITTKLNDDINKSIQDAFNTLIAADNNGQLDTVEELTTFRDKMYADLDMSITGFSDASIKQMQFLVGEVDKARAEAVTYEKNANTINKDMSVAQGYYVNGNGDPVISATTGTRIDLPAEPPMEPVFDAKTGRLTTFELDENGQLIGTVQNTYPEATFTEQTIQNYAKLVAQGKLDISDVPENVSSNDTFLSSLAMTPSKSEEPKVTKIGDKSYTYNATTGKYEEVEIAEKEIKPTGNIGTVSYTNEAGTTKDIKVDTIAQDDLLTALNSMGGTAIVGEGLRTEQRQQELYDAYQAGTGGLAAKPGTSSHETGLAIDLYGGQDETGKLLPPTAEQVKAMNANGWFQTAGEEDMGHFEYKGVAGKEELTSSQLIQGDNLAIKIYGKRAGAKPENKQRIYDMLKQGYSIDEIEDTVRLGGYGTEYTGDLKSTYENISAGFSKDKKESNQAVLEDKIKEYGGDSSEVKGYLKRLARESMDTESSKVVKGYELLEKNLGDIKDDLVKYEELGGDTGLFKGKIEDLSGKIGQVQDVELRKIATKIQKTIQTYRKAISGAAFTESESAEYKSLFPSSSNVGELNTALLEAVLESNTIAIDTAYEQQMGADEYNNVFKAVEKGPEEIAIKESTMGTTGAGLGAALGFGATPKTTETDPLGLGIGGGESDPLGLFK